MMPNDVVAKPHLFSGEHDFCIISISSVVNSKNQTGSEKSDTDNIVYKLEILSSKWTTAAV